MGCEHDPRLPVNADRLREQARFCLRTGRLPLGEQVRTWAGYGSGFQCLVCSGPILRAEVEFEVEIAETLIPGGATTARFHRACHAIWDHERVRVLDEIRASGEPARLKPP